MSDDAETERATFETAADWKLRLTANPADDALSQAFDCWVADPRHRAAWTDVQRTWTMLGEAEPAQVVQLASRRRPRRRRLAAAGLAAAAVLAAWLALPGALVAVRADYRTALGETERVQMADGSVVELAGASAIRTDLDDTARHVGLLAGEAFFDVAPDPARPFVVEAAGVTVTVHGTAFDVLVTSESTTVALLHGVVEAAPRPAEPGGVHLNPGERIVIDHRSGNSRVEPVAPEEIGAWRQGRVFLDDMTLTEATEIVGRYHAAWIAIPDRALANRRINALIDLTDPDAALELLATTLGARVRTLTPLSRVITRF